MSRELPDRATLSGWVDAGLSIRKIAARTGYSKSTVAMVLRRYGLSRTRVRIPDDLRKKLGM